LNELGVEIHLHPRQSEEHEGCARDIGRVPDAPPRPIRTRVALQKLDRACDRRISDGQPAFPQAPENAAAQVGRRGVTELDWRVEHQLREVSQIVQACRPK